MANYQISEIAFGSNSYTLFDEQCRETLIDIINTGPKNLIPDLSYGSTKGTAVPYVDIPILAVPGSYALNIETLESDASSDDSLFELYAENGTLLTDSGSQISHGSNVTATFIITGQTATQLRIYAANTASGSTNKHVWVSFPMLCHKSLYDLTPTYAYYKPTILELQNEVADDTAIISRLVDTAGVKNLAVFSRADGVYGPYNGVTFTLSNGAVTISGTAGTYKNFKLMGLQDYTTYEYGVPIPKGKYRLTGLPSGASSSTFRYIFAMTPSNGGTRTSTSIYEDYEFTVENDTTVIELMVYVATNYAATTPVTIKPMICRVEEYEASPAYVAPAKTVEALTKKVAELIDASGTKNRLDLSWLTTPQTINGVEWAVNATTGEITGTRVSTNSSASTLYLLQGGNTANVTINEPMTISGCPQEGSSTKYEIQVAWKTSASATSTTTLHDYGSGNGVSVAAGCLRYIACQMRPDQTGTITFKPMLCTTDDWGWSKNFVPYKA